MNTISLKVYAKINLSMEILGRRPDGYHNIRSLMQSISLYDTISIARSDHLQLKCNDKALETADNLCILAYRALEKYLGTRLVGAEIYLDKKIPYLSGLGGGSADAAGVLTGLNTLLDLRLSATELLSIATEIGSDVPACLMGGLVVATGKGEQLEKLAPLEKPLELVVIKPPVDFSSKYMYELLDKSENFSDKNYTQLVLDSFTKDRPYLYNGFTVPCESAEYIDRAIAYLVDAGAAIASMTGAGSAVYGIFADKVSAISAVKKLRHTIGSDHYIAYCSSVDIGNEIIG